MSNWSHKHIIDLSSFSLEDYRSVFELAKRFEERPRKGARKIPALQGRLVATLFFEPSTRTRTSFELAAKCLSADIQSFNSANSAMNKGESPLDTALTYIAMGADILIVRHRSTNVPEQIAKEIDKKNMRISILNAGDGLHSHPSQGLLDLYTIAKYFNPINPSIESIKGKEVVIVGDVLHSRVARSNLWALTACGANVVLCGPGNLVPDQFIDFVKSPPSGQEKDPVDKRGKISIERSLKRALPDADVVMTLRLQKERMEKNLISSIHRYHDDFGLTHDRLKLCKKSVPVLHPGPVNRGIEMSSLLLEDKSISQVDQQVQNGIPIRMALLYLMSAIDTIE